MFVEVASQIPEIAPDHEVSKRDVATDTYGLQKRRIPKWKTANAKECAESGHCHKMESMLYILPTDDFRFQRDSQRESVIWATEVNKVPEVPKPTRDSELDEAVAAFVGINEDDDENYSSWFAILMLLYMVRSCKFNRIIITISIYGCTKNLKKIN